MSGFAKALARIKAMLTRWDRGSFYAVPVHASRQRPPVTPQDDGQGGSAIA